MRSKQTVVLIEKGHTSQTSESLYNKISNVTNDCLTMNCNEI